MANEKKKIKFNVIDVLIILAFVVLIAGFSFYANGHWQTNDNSRNKNEKTVVYSLSVNEITKELADAITVGDEIKDSANDTVKGKITKIISKEKFVNKESLNEETGEYVTAVHPNLYTVVISVESSCTENDNDILIDNTKIKIGRKYHFKTNNYAFYGIIKDIELK